MAFLWSKFSLSVSRKDSANIAQSRSNRHARPASLSPSRKSISSLFDFGKRSPDDTPREPSRCQEASNYPIYDPSNPDHNSALIPESSQDSRFSSLRVFPGAQRSSRSRLSDVTNCLRARAGHCSLSKAVPDTESLLPDTDTPKSVRFRSSNSYIELPPPTSPISIPTLSQLNLNADVVASTFGLNGPREEPTPLSARPESPGPLTAAQENIPASRAEQMLAEDVFQDPPVQEQDVSVEDSGYIADHESEYSVGQARQPESWPVAHRSVSTFLLTSVEEDIDACRGCLPQSLNGDGDKENKDEYCICETINSTKADISPLHSAEKLPLKADSPPSLPTSASFPAARHARQGSKDDVLARKLEV